MGKINVLSFAVANLIAAGEVVDRPASVIKELMENAIDAHAHTVTVEIQNGGVTFMRVTDDGCGMEPEDLPVAIRRHATSKIHDAADLDGIVTLGFRGEALAAIASVSDMRILSKQHDAKMGAVLEAHGGEIVSLQETGCMDGTTVLVEALFSNVPARRKFLKKDVTEAQAVSVAVERVALSHPEISFKLIIDGDIRLQTAGDGDLKNTVFAVFGRDFANRLIPLESEYEGIGVSGFIGRSDNVKGTRNYQNFFINGRWVKSKTVMAALEQAYCSYVAPEKFPSCVLNITLNPARMDVNVHPAKLEVKFSNEKLVFEAVYYAVRHALEANETRPDLKLPGGKTTTHDGGALNGTTSARRLSDAFAEPLTRNDSLKKQQIAIPFADMAESTPAANRVPAAKERPAAKKGGFEHITAEDYVKTYLQGGAAIKPGKTAPVPQPQKNASSSPSLPPLASAADIPLPSDADVPPLQPPTPMGEQATGYSDMPIMPVGTTEAEERPLPPLPNVEQTNTACRDTSKDTQALPNEQPPVTASDTLPDYRILGEAFHSYVFVEAGQKLLVIDKHAAHERILFEELKEQLHKTEPASQMLMLPIDVMMMSDEVSIVEQYRKELEAVGFLFETARNTVKVSALPIGIESGAVGDMLCAIADRIKNNTGSAALTRDIIFEKALYQGACKAAIKAGREYADGHIEWLVERLMRLPDITFCPHGRPVAMEISKQNLDHQFERT